MLKVIFWDFGGVLGRFDHMKTCRRLTAFSPFSADEIYRRIFRGPAELEKRYDAGLDTETFFRGVKQAIRANGLTASAFGEIWSNIFGPNPGIGDILADLRPDIANYVLSNTNELHWHWISQLPVIKKFFVDVNQQILSFRVGFCKPDGLIFLEAFRRALVPAEEALFIDDKPGYLNAFRARLGVKGILYNCEIHHISDLRNALRSRAALLE